MFGGKMNKERTASRADRVMPYSDDNATGTTIVTMCAHCKRIKKEDSKGGKTCWCKPGEDELLKPGVEVSHGVCPECMLEIYPAFLHK